MTRVYFLAGLLAAGSILTGCGGGSRPDNPPAPVAEVPATTRSQYGPLEFTQTTPKTVYNKGEEIVMTFTVKNVSPDAVLIIPNVAGQGGTYKRISQNNQTIYSPFQGAGGGGVFTKTVAPGEVVTYTEGWLQNNDRGKQVPSGTYSFYVRLAAVGVGQTFVGETGADQLLGPPPIDVVIK